MGCKAERRVALTALPLPPPTPPPAGRVPAALNGIVGIKPSLGRFSTTGVVPACYLLDCVSVFALSVEDGAAVARIMTSDDISDPTFRPRDRALLAKALPAKAAAPAFRFAVPAPEFLDFSGPGGEPARRAMEAAMGDAVKRMRAIGGELVTLDFSPLAETATLLYGGPFVAERYSGERAREEAGGGLHLEGAGAALFFNSSSSSSRPVEGPGAAAAKERVCTL